MIHIIFGESAYGSLKFALKDKEDRVIAFPDYLGEGPITELTSAARMEKRSKWLGENFHIEERNKLEEAIIRLQTLKDSQVIVWASENAAEQFGLRLVCHILANRNCPIFICNTYRNILFMNQGKNIQMEIRHTGEVISAQMNAMLDGHLLEQLVDSEIIQLGEQANQLMKGKSVLRTWQRGQIIEDVETRDDAIILHYLQELLNESGEPFIKAPRLIGHVLGHSVHDIHDTWIEYRLLALIAEGNVDYRGDLRNMRTYAVKLPQ